MLQRSKKCISYLVLSSAVVPQSLLSEMVCFRSYPFKAPPHTQSALIGQLTHARAFVSVIQLSLLM